MNALRQVLSCLGRASKGALAASLLTSACSQKEHAVPVAQAPVSQDRLGAIARLEAPLGLDPQRVALGGRLFRDQRLSGNGKLSCASCHDLARGGGDRVAFSVGANGAPLALNTPTVFNAALGFRQFWDGRAVTLEEQIDGPLLADDEMGSSWDKVLPTLRADPEVSAQFAKSYPSGVTQATVKDAIATFERSLVTTGAPFDRFLSGETDAISASAREGYRLFTGYGCSSCHQGRVLGGNMFQRLGVMADYFVDRGHETTADQGRFNVTRDEADRHVFKVPSLRNVARTAPYLHDGSAATLEETVRIMALYQLGRDLDASDVADLVAFLESLTGVYEGRSL